VFHIQEDVRLDRLNASRVNTQNILRPCIYLILSRLRYGLENFGISSTAGKFEKLVCSPKCPDLPWIPPCLLPNGCRELFSRDKMDGKWSWPLISISYQG